MSPQGFKTTEYTFRTILISECYSVNVHAKTLYLTILHVRRYEVREQIQLCVHACVWMQKCCMYMDVSIHL